MTWTFTIPGPPVAKQRPRKAPAGHFYTPKRTQDYECAVAWAAKAAGVKLEPKVPYTLDVRFYLSAHRRDLDNCLKSVQDGLQRMGDGWDDSQIMSLTALKHLVRDASEERTVVTIGRRFE